MNNVPQKTLNWLYSVLSRDYHDVNRTYNDAAHALAVFYLSPRTDVYTYPDGSSALLLHLSGTIPVQFRGTVFRFPISIWVPHAYPRAPPEIYVMPSAEMQIRPGQHVSGEGKIYHHYLAHWASAAERSNITEFLSILREVFAKEPPVVARPQNQGQPPAVPPPPQNHNRTIASSSGQGAATPPPPPPKESASSEASRSVTPQSAAVGRYDRPAPLPPASPTAAPDPRAYPSSANRNSYYQSGPIGSPVPTPGASHQQQMGGYAASQQPRPAPVHPGGPPNPAASRAVYGPYGPQTHATIPQSPGHLPQAQSGVPIPPQAGQTQGHPPYPQNGSIPPQAYGHVQAQPPTTTKAAIPDLLSSGNDMPIATPADLTVNSGPAPPIPPNPEKDALLQAISRALTETLHKSIQQNQAALPALEAQYHALQNTHHALDQELAHLTHLQQVLQSNNAILQSSLQSADAVIADAQSRRALPSSDPRGLPKVDDILTAPTTVGKQLYELVADLRGIEAATWALQKGLVQGRIVPSVWSRQMRSLQREALMKKALTKKIGKGLILEDV